MAVAALCNEPIEQNGVCKVATVNSVTTMGNSGNFVGCSAGLYLSNYICIACSGQSQFVDYLGINCLTTCAATSYIFALNGLKVCKTGMSCISNLY